MAAKSRIRPTADGGVRGWWGKNSHSGREGNLGACANRAMLKLGTVAAISCHSLFGGQVDHLPVRVKL